MANGLRQSTEMKTLVQHDFKYDNPIHSEHSSTHGGSRSEFNDGQDDQDVSYDLQFHKVIVKRAMDIAMLTANANQLRLLFTYNSQSQTFVACVTLVILSLLLQTSVAICLVIVKSHPKTRRNVHMRRLKIATKIGIVIITVINILVASLVITPNEIRTTNQTTVNMEKKT
ncbi:ninjurin-2-like [Culex quinquefasciatus]|uniref:ninjurin-2-like n=1 Tax=Culex quinquefasciatus TaxID=7176 RepID=UPI0018E328AC|nr:ninjurin-2-like [Culex quinquefasciatus]